MQQKIALVTGGSRGIGKAIVRTLATAGYGVAFSYVSDQAAASALVDELRAEGTDCIAIRCDIADADSVRQMSQATEQHFGRIDLLVNNAGITRDGLLATLSLDDIQQVIATNLIGPMLCCQGVLPCMMRQRKGSIINISSVAAQKPGKGQSNYAAAKGGIEAMTRALAVELAPRNIRVNAIAPGIVSTEMSEDLLSRHAEDVQRALLIKRYATPEEIARAVLFLADDALYMSGEVLAINGGLKMP